MTATFPFGSPTLYKAAPRPLFSIPQLHTDPNAHAPSPVNPQQRKCLPCTPCLPPAPPPAPALLLLRHVCHPRRIRPPRRRQVATGAGARATGQLRRSRTCPWPPCRRSPPKPPLLQRLLPHSSLAGLPCPVLQLASHIAWTQRTRCRWAGGGWRERLRGHSCVAEAAISPPVLRRPALTSLQRHLHLFLRSRRRSSWALTSR